MCTAVAASISSAGALCHRNGECPMRARSGICSEGVSSKQQQVRRCNRFCEEKIAIRRVCVFHFASVIQGKACSLIVFFLLLPCPFFHRSSGWFRLCTKQARRFDEPMRGDRRSVGGCWSFSHHRRLSLCLCVVVNGSR